jgi:hypothetical protein
MADHGWGSCKFDRLVKTGPGCEKSDKDTLFRCFGFVYLAKIKVMESSTSEED